MGEISDMILEGILCDLCGIYIGEAVGYPRKCIKCASIRKPCRKKKRPENKKAKGGA